LQSDRGNGELPMRGRLRMLASFQQLGVISVIVVLIVLLGIFSPLFLSGRNIINVLQQVSTLGILSMGMTVLMVSGGIDLSVGATISVVACVVGQMLKGGTPVGVCILTGFALGALIAGINGALAAYTRAAPFIVTLGTMTMLQGVAVLITKGFPVTNLGARFEFLGMGAVLNVPFIVILFFVVTLACHIFLRYLRIGRTAYAIGGNERTAYLAGIRVRRNKIIFCMICGFLTALAAMVLASRVSSAQATMGNGFELRSIGAVVIGGTPLTGGRGSVVGTLTGVLLLGIIANGLNLLHVDPSWQYVATGGIIVLAVLIQKRQGR
jgi:ribose/xylose/arabinose/galactoside ABC-type transport system permease subunit